MYEQSEHIKAAIDNPMRRDCISLPEHKAETFSSFLEWVYEGHVNLPDTKRVYHDYRARDNEGDDFWWAVGRLYVLADYLIAPGLMKYLVDLVFQKGHLGLHDDVTWICGPPSGMVTYIYSNAPSSCPFRALLVDWYVWNVDKNWWEKGADAEKYPLETKTEQFLTDVSIGAMKRMYASIKKDNTRNPFRKTEHIYCDEEMKVVKSALRSKHAARRAKKYLSSIHDEEEDTEMD